MYHISSLIRCFRQLTMPLLIVFSTFLSSQPVMAKYSGGGGTMIDPYRIRTVADWQSLMASSSDWNKYFIMTADIDLKNITLTPVGDSFPMTVFFGVLDGNGHIISNVNVNKPNNDSVGLFGNLGLNGQIRNLSITNVTINGAQ